MKIINHGTWSLYYPSKRPQAAPPNTMFAKSDKDGTDWYEYINGGNFNQNSLKLMCSYQMDKWIVGPVVDDVTLLFPAGQMVLEIFESGADYPMKYFGGKSYDPTAQEFAEHKWL